MGQARWPAEEVQEIESEVTEGNMAIYKRGDVYWYKFMWNGRHIRESAKTGNPRTARQIESARKTELAKGEVGIKDRPPAPTFDEFSKRFLKWIATEKAAKPK